MRTLFAIVLFFASLNAHAKYAGAQANQIPAAHIFPTTNAILFPAVVTAAGVNASALGVYGTRTDLQVGVTKGNADDPMGIFAGTEIGSSGFGVGLGYVGEKYTNRTINNMYGGFGVKIDAVSIGAATRVLDTSQGEGPVFDVSMMSYSPTGFNWGLVAYNVAKKAQVDLGIGIAGGRRYNFEINALLPPLMNSAGESTVFTGAATLFGTEWLGLSGRVSYALTPAAFTYMGGATVWFNDTFNIFVFYTSPSYVTGGLSFSF